MVDLKQEINKIERIKSPTKGDSSVEYIQNIRIFENTLSKMSESPKYLIKRQKITFKKI